MPSGSKKRKNTGEPSRTLAGAGSSSRGAAGTGSSSRGAAGTRTAATATATASVSSARGSTYKPLNPASLPFYPAHGRDWHHNGIFYYVPKDATDLNSFRYDSRAMTPAFQDSYAYVMSFGVGELLLRDSVAAISIINNPTDDKPVSGRCSMVCPDQTTGQWRRCSDTTQWWVPTHDKQGRLSVLEAWCPRHAAQPGGPDYVPEGEEGAEGGYSV